jgi:uncharacterized membrane protein YbaN (DUF454 family)
MLRSSRAEWTLWAILDWNGAVAGSMNTIKRIALTACGTLCVALGGVGLFIPVLPTTPFLLLAAVCYARSSKRFYDWLLTNRWCGEYIRNYREGRGILLQQKILTIALLWLTMGSTAGFFVTLGWVRLILLGIGVAVTLHLVRIKTFTPTPPISPLPNGSDVREQRASIPGQIT